MDRTRAALIAGLALALIGTGAARGASSSLRYLETAVSPAVADPSGGYAYLKSSTLLTVHATSGKTRRYPVDSGCSPTAMGHTSVGLSCSNAPGTVGLVDVASGFRRISGPEATQSYTPLAVGTRWAVLGFYNTSDSKSTGDRLALDLATGKAIDLGTAEGMPQDPFGAGDFLDPDTAQLGVKLCAPVTRRSAGGEFDATAYYPLTRAGRWVLQRFEDPLETAFLQQCGSTHVQQFLPDARARLGTNLLALQVGHAVRLRDLKSHRTQTFRWPSGTRPGQVSFLAAGRSAIVSIEVSSGDQNRWRIYRADMSRSH